MTKRINFITTALFLALAILLTLMTTQAASTGTAKTQSQLEKLLADKSVSTIKISTTKKTTLTIPSVDYDKKLIINAPNARIVNSGKFSDITVKNLTKYIENTKGNSLNVIDDKLSVNVAKKASLKCIAVSNEKAKLHLVANGDVSKLIINSAKVVGIHGAHKKPVSVVANDKNTKINISSLVVFMTGDMQSEVKPVIETPKADIVDSNKVTEKTKADIEAELEAAKQQAYNKAYSDWLNYFVAQSQTVNKGTSTNTQQSNNKTSNGTVAPITPSAITPTEPDNESPTENTDETVEEPNEPTTVYQMTFTHWDNCTSFNTYTGRSQYVYVSNIEDGATPLEGTDWQIAVVSNNEMATDESLIWSNLIDATDISGIADSTYYQNAYKLTFNENGVYYLRAKYNDQYVYSIPIVVNTDNTTYLEAEIDGKLYMTQAQVSKINATFKFTSCTPEEVESLANASYIKYKNSSVLHRGLYVNHVRTDLNSHIIYYTFNKCDEYNSSGVLFQTATYNDNYKPLQVDSYSNGVLTKSRVMTYDELGRTYTTMTINYDADGNITSKSGYYYIYDENGNSTKHNGFPVE